jgi:hypothetical protein
MSSAARNYDALSDAERKDREALLRSLVVTPSLRRERPPGRRRRACRRCAMTPCGS